MNNHGITEQHIPLMIANCDERIETFKSHLKELGEIIKPLNIEYVVEGEEEYLKSRGFEGIGDVGSFEKEVRVRLDIYKTEKMVYNALLNSKSNKDIFKLLLAKSDELQRLGLEVKEIRIERGWDTEGEYVQYCNGLKEHRDCILTMCEIGYGGKL